VIVTKTSQYHYKSSEAGTHTLKIPSALQRLCVYYVCMHSLN